MLLKWMPYNSIYRQYCSKIVAQEKIRNIGIIAHVDAGKTTVTERLLYLAGAINVAGNVDKGNTVTDFLDIERERGITVQSAAVNLDWMKHRINLIDTPGHVDFKVEVERCVRVLDGIVCVIDGSAGVQPQTLTVWNQASKFQLPAIFFVNKLDKKEGNFEKSVDSIEQKLGVKAIATMIPYGDCSQNLVGVIDILNRKCLKFDNVEARWNVIENGSRESDLFGEARSELCYNIANYNDVFMQRFLDENDGKHDGIEDSLILSTLRDLMVRGTEKIATVTCGSAMKSLHCVQPVLDSVVHFFPSPNMRNGEFRKVFGDELAGLVFKIAHDKRRGQLSYTRVYTGKLLNNSMVYNSSQGMVEGPVKIFTPYADELRPTEFVDEGNIAVVSGLQRTITGDTILLSQISGERAFENIGKSNTNLLSIKNGIEGSSVVFAGIDAPEAVYFCCIEPPSAKKQQIFNRALDELTREDPSMKIRLDKETGQTIVEAQGELHLEAIKDRLLRGYGLDVFIGKLQVAYREMITETEIHTSRIENVVAEKKRTEFVSLTMKIEPSEEHKAFKKVSLNLAQPVKTIRADWHKAINEGCSNALQNGPLASFPVHAVNIVLTEIVCSGGKINPALCRISACAQKCVSEALSKAGIVLTEPVMEIEINIQSDVPTQPILNELIKRRARIEFSDRINDSTIRIVANLPLAEMEGLSRMVRTLSSGFGDINVQISGYQQVPDFERIAILQKKSGDGSY